MIASLRHRRALAALASLLLAASGSEGRADDAQPAGASAPDAEEPQGSVDLDEIVVRVAPPAAPAAPGAAVTVVDAREYAGEAKTVGEMVATAPGVAVREYGGLGQLATVSIRGASASGVRILLDGLPLNTAFGGAVDLSTIPRQWISTIEVVRGTEGAQFGSGALGGALNIVTRAPSSGEWSAQLSRGSFDTWSAGANAGFGGSGWGALVAGGWDQTGGQFSYEFDDRPSLPSPTVMLQRENNAARSGGILAKGFAHAGGGRWDVITQLSGGHRELPGSPYATTPHDSQDDLRAGAVVRHARLLAERLTGTAELVARYDRLDARIAPFDTDQRGAAAAAQAAVTAQLGALAIDGGLRAGGERLTADGLDHARTREELAAFATTDVAVWRGRVHVGGAARLERIGAFDGWSGKAGATVDATRSLSFSASAGRTFRAPSFAELYLQQALLEPNPDLRPEDGVGGDVGAAARGAAGLASVTAFAQLYRDLIVYERASSGRAKPFNSAKALVRGLEVEAATHPWGPASTALSGAYTLLHSESLRGEPAIVGQELPMRPRHRVFARLSSEWRWLAGHAEAHHVSAQWQDTRNLKRIAAATTFNAGASFRITSRPAVRLHLDARNLADARDLTDGFANPLPGRMLLVGLRAGSSLERTEP